MTRARIERHIEGPIGEIRIAEGGAGALDAIATASEALGAEPSVHVVLLTAIEEGGFANIDAAGIDAANAIERMPQPVIACIEGAASSAGFALALACDLRIASQSALFALTEVADGALPPLGATQRLSRLAGRGQAMAMVLLGESVHANAAYDCGLVNEVVNDGGTTTRARELATRIAAQGPIAVRYAKEAIRQGLDMPLEQALRHETDLTIILQSTDDRAEGVRAFLEKRPPHFKGS